MLWTIGNSLRPLCKSPWLRGPQWNSQIRSIRLILRPVNEPSKSIRWFTKISYGLTTCAALKLASSNWRVSCQASNEHHSRVSVVTNLQSELPPLKFDWDRFLEMLYPLTGYIICAVVSAFIVAVLNIQIPIVLGSLVNVVSKSTKETTDTFLEQMKQPSKRLIQIFGLQALFTFGYISILAIIGEKIACQMKQELFESIMRQDIAFFDKYRTGDIVNRLTSDIQDFKSSFKMCISQGLRNVTQIVGCAVSLYVLSPQMTLGMMVSVPGVVLLGSVISRFLRKLSRRAQEESSKAIIVGEEAISNIRTVRSFAMEGKEKEIFNEITNSACAMNQSLGFGIGMFQGGTNLFINGIVLGTIYAGGYLVTMNQLSHGDLMAFLVAAQTIQRSLAQLTLLFGNAVRGLESGARVFQIINMQPKISISGGKTIPYHSFIAEIEFDRVFFAYPTRPEQVILKDFNLKIKPGQTIAIVGSSGNGKSTIVSLLERFYDVSSGSIRISGFDIRDLDPTWLRGRAIGLINQEPILFATSIMENIRYGNPSATDNQVREAARIANADSFILNFPKGFDTIVGERGVTVSGGQKQRIAIARALLKSPSILILDEATSALDVESEQLVQAALDQACRGRTVLVIAHRLSTIKHADLIVVLDKGQVVEMGSHGSLLQLKGHYWNLIRQQEEK